MNNKLIYWWQGFVRIRIKGKKLERLVNRMMNRRFAAWHIQRKGEDEAELSITLPDFFQLRPILRETGCKARIIHKVGLPFFYKRTRRRAGLVAGLISFALILYVLSSMIWFIRIEGVTLPEHEVKIRQELASLGVKPGKFKFQAPDHKEIQNKMMQALPETTWIGFEFSGTTALVKVVEKTLPEMKEPTNPRHLVAKKKAIIHDIFVEQGQPMVKPNQYVKPGDILVSGEIGTEEDPQIVSATGVVLGEVWYEGNITIPLTQKKEVLTGEQIKRYYLEIGEFHTHIWGFQKNEYEQYDTAEKDYTFEWKKWQLPIKWSVRTEKESASTTVQLTEDEALELGLKMGHAKMRRQLPPEAEIKEENVLRKRVENDKVYIKVHYTVIEEIASEHSIIQGD